MSKKPRLQIYRFNPNVKGLFLEHWSKSVFENEENDGKKRLLRSILISNCYLLASRQSKIYKLYFPLFGVHEPNFLYFSNSSNFEGSPPSDPLKMTIKNFCQMNKLLNAPFMSVCMNFNSNIDEYEEVFNAFNGKFFLRLEGRKAINFINQYSARIDEISSDIQNILDVDVPKLNLEVCHTTEHNNLDQLKQILLKHCVKKLRIRSSIYDQSNQFQIYEQQFFENFPYYPHLNELTFWTSHTKNCQFLDVLKKLLEYFPNLKNFHLNSCFSYLEEQDVDPDSKALTNYIIEKIKKAREFQKAYPQLDKFKFECFFNCQTNDYNRLFEEALEPLSSLTGIKKEELKEKHFYEQDDGEFCYWESAEEFKWTEGNLCFSLEIEIHSL